MTLRKRLLHVTLQLEEARREIRQLNQELEGRDQELAEKAEALRKSNRDLEHFAYVVSHDLQEPLRMVGSYTQLLARRYKGQLDDDADKFIGFAVDGAARMKRMISDLLTYSRAAAPGQSQEPTPLDAALDQALENLEWSIQQSGAVVHRSPLPTVIANGGQLTQVFQNLVGNGIKFRADGRTPEIHVAAEESDGSWVVSVRDNGIGIEPDCTERIFSVFERLHQPKEYSGTGIGLAICERIIERHGGRIRVESEPGHGSTFSFTLRSPDVADLREAG